MRPLDPILQERFQTFISRVDLQGNADHRRTLLVARTRQGEAVYAQVMARYAGSADSLKPPHIDAADMVHGHALVRELVRRLDDESGGYSAL